MHIGYLAPMSWDPLMAFLPIGVTLPDPLYFETGSQYVAEFIRQGHHVSVFTLSSNLDSPMVVHGNGITLHIGMTRTGWKAKVADIMRFERKQLALMLQRDPCDVYHANWTYEYACAALSVCPQKTLVTAHDKPTDILRYTSWRAKPYCFMRMLMAIYVLRRTHYFSALSPFDAAYFRSKFKYNKDILITPNGIQSYGVPPKCKADQGRDIRFAFVSNQFYGLKNGPTLLAAWRSVFENMPTAKLYLIGMGTEQGGKLDAKIQSDGLKNIICVGFISNKKQLMQFLKNNVDILVHPSFTEGMSLSVLEAMSLGIPVVGGERSGGMPWLLDYGRAGYLTDISDATKLAATMLKIAADTHSREEISSSAVNRASEFDISKMSNKLLEIYRHISLEAMAIGDPICLPPRPGPPSC
jgi:glycosyltransferase involved in cell wall biosynthesis